MLTLSSTYNRNVLTYGVATENSQWAQELVQENLHLPPPSFSMKILSIKRIIIVSVQNQTLIYTQRRTATVEHAAPNLEANVFHPEATRLPSTGLSSVRGTTFHSPSVHCSPASRFIQFSRLQHGRAFCSRRDGRFSSSEYTAGCDRRRPLPVGAWQK